MAPYLTHKLILDLIWFQTVVLLIAITNILILHRARSRVQLQQYPTVSILVPARNEERSVGGCVQSLLEQDYPSFEVIALDDQSSDGTYSILEQIATKQPRLKAIGWYSTS